MKNDSKYNAPQNTGYCKIFQPLLGSDLVTKTVSRQTPPEQNLPGQNPPPPPQEKILMLVQVHWFVQPYISEVYLLVQP